MTISLNTSNEEAHRMERRAAIWLLAVGILIAINIINVVVK